MSGTQHLSQGFLPPPKPHTPLPFPGVGVVAWGLAGPGCWGEGSESTSPAPAAPRELARQGRGRWEPGPARAASPTVGGGGHTSGVRNTEHYLSIFS